MEILVTIIVLLLLIVLSVIYTTFIFISTRHKVRLADSIIYMMKYNEPVKIDIETLEGLNLTPKEKDYLISIQKQEVKLQH
ncbi:hypothetical protein [Pseudoalteromonas luteoviolacea]|uniref:Uncharacterized protein n=1 Tax=Pseudoalteromonas luteoviolacea S4060-1 TaxID=1365257 RepID=A0A161XYR6_9GAMM|nr:hypothetical protein [Pseudoalteromonas luteoviolacea]KZN33043.1 hypothetical protein N480_24280 [Pseudoalteromonas luteoviolacea S2607]KZN59061.1 hypothetical protein N478_09525 [Pseudoalteromonas luteoviolacea S4060-1]